MRSICAAFAPLLLFAPVASAQTDNRALVIPRKGAAFIGQFLKPDPVEFQFVPSDTKKETTLKEFAGLSSGQVALKDVVALSFSRNQDPLKDKSPPARE